MYKSGRYEFAMKYRYRQGTFYFVIQTSIFIANLLLSPAACTRYKYIHSTNGF